MTSSFYRRSAAALALLCAFAPLHRAWAATQPAPADSVLSVSIKKADGTTGQNTATGSGVKTDHIQDGAVTAAKIQDGAVTGAKIQDGSVTDSKIAGQISTSKLVVGSTAGTVAAGDHTHSWVVEAQANRNQVALLRWYDANLSATFATDPMSLPYAIAFDGAHMWVTNCNLDWGTPGTVSKIRASDGATVGTYTVGLCPQSITFDGANIWVANRNSNSLTVLKASDGSFVQTVPTASSPQGLAFDGVNIWVGNRADSSVSKVSPTTGTIVQTYATARDPVNLAFDGKNMWVACLYGTLARVDPSGNVLNIKIQGRYTNTVAFDGTNVWVTNPDGQAEVYGTDGSFVRVLDFIPNTFTGGPAGLAFDGVNMWIANTNGMIAKKRASDGAHLGIYTLPGAGEGGGPTAVAFDGANIWVTNTFNKTVSKM